jgi:hypothetical protein
VNALAIGTCPSFETVTARTPSPAFNGRTMLPTIPTSSARSVLNSDARVAGGMTSRHRVASTITPTRFVTAAAAVQPQDMVARAAPIARKSSRRESRTTIATTAISVRACARLPTKECFMSGRGILAASRTA